VSSRRGVARDHTPATEAPAIVASAGSTLATLAALVVASRASWPSCAGASTARCRGGAPASLRHPGRGHRHAAHRGGGGLPGPQPWLALLQAM